MSNSGNKGCVSLSFRGEHIPAFKNGKQKTKFGMITDPKKQLLMTRLTLSLESQLSSATQTTAAGTRMDPCLHSLIAWSKQFDDSRQWIPEQHVYSKEVKKGEEGFDLIIELL